MLLAAMQTTRHPAPETKAQSPADIPPRGWKNIAKDTWKEAGEDNLDIVGAGVAFYVFSAFVPLLTALVLGYGLFANPETVARHIQTLAQALPQGAAQIITDQLANMTQSAGTTTGFALLIAIALAVWGASKGAGAIMTALNVAYDVEESRGFVKRTLMRLALTAGAILVLAAAVLAISGVQLVEQLLPSLGGFTHFLIQAALFALAAITLVVMLAALYRYGPNRPDAEWRWITPGSIVAAAVWLIATLGFGFYVANFGSYNATYGSLGAVIVFLTWLYLSAYIILLGAEMNGVIEERVGQQKVQEQSSEGPAPRNISGGKTAAAGSATGRPTESQPPSPAAVVAKIGLLSLLLPLLGRRKPAGVAA